MDVNAVFTPKQQAYLLAPDHRINILSGSVRSGKTYISLFKFALRVKYSPFDSTYMLIALTSNTLKRNVLAVLLSIVGEDNLTYSMGNKEGWLFGHHILLEYAPDERAEQKIRGLTLDGAYCDELTLYPSTFFSMLLSRLSKPHATLYATTNPDNPMHWLKANYIDRADELDCRLWNFKLNDNTFLDPAYIENIKKEYTGVFYRRFIDGDWVIADGLVYSAFDEATMLIEAPSLSRLNSPEYAEKYVSIDYGIENPTAFCMFAWNTRLSEWHMVRDYSYGGRDNMIPKTDPELYQDLLNFCHGVNGINATIIDPSAKSLIVLMQKDQRFRVMPANNEVISGISFVNTMFGQGKLKIASNCKATYKELYAYAWDTEKSRQQGKDVVIKANDHNMDALRYFCYTIVKPKTRLYGITMPSTDKLRI